MARVGSQESVKRDKIMTIRPRRSVLYMPGSNARALEKARKILAEHQPDPLDPKLSKEFGRIIQGLENGE